MTSYFRNANDELQRFEGPSLDQPDSDDDRPPVLSPEAEAVLQSFEFFATPARENSAQIFSLEGDELFHVSKTISAQDLRTLIRLHKSRFEEGFARGRIAMQTQIRDLLGAAAIPVESDY